MLNTNIKKFLISLDMDVEDICRVMNAMKELPSDIDCEFNGLALESHTSIADISVRAFPKANKSEWDFTTNVSDIENVEDLQITILVDSYQEDIPSGVFEI